MRTTIDLPEELLRRLKVRAALDGVTLKVLVTRYVADGLAQGELVDSGAGAPMPVRLRRTKLPVVIPARGRSLRAFSNADIQALLDGEDAAHAVIISDHLD